MFSIATGCSGIGSPEQAISELEEPHEIIFACELDNWARKTYLSNFTPKLMLTDMTKCDYVGPSYYADLFIAGIPCQSFSLAGKRLGELDKRGLLFYDFYRYVKNQQPKAFIIENVKGLLSDNNGITFQNWIQLLGQSMNTHLNMFNHEDSLMYNLHFTTLNAKDYGLPQSRERVFIVGIRNDIPNSFRFPGPKRLNKRLIDVLESVVDEKYYLSDKFIQYLLDNSDRTRIIDNSYHVSPCILANQAKTGTDSVLLKEIILDKAITLPGFESSNRVYSEQGLAPTLRAKQQGLILVGGNSKFPYRIRRYTPLECMRLQGYPDSFNKPCSDHQTYKQAGNSIPVHVMKAIIKNILPIIKG